MSRSYWLPIIALGGFLSAPALAQVAKGPKDDPVTHESAQENAARNAAEKPATADAPIGPVPSGEPERSTVDENGDHGPNQDAQRYWYFGEGPAQWIMAVAAAAAIVISGIGICLIWKTLEATRRALREARRTTRAAIRAADAATNSNAVTVAKDRAFVFVDNIVFERDSDNHTLIARVTWKNGGTTPTKAFRTCVNINHFVTPLPSQFTHQDHTRGPFQRALVPPQGTLKSGMLPIPEEGKKIAKFRASDGRSYPACLLIWGWCEYNDVFPGTARHRTEFCREVVIGNPEILCLPGIMYADAGVHTFPVTDYNNTDDECIKPLQTNPPHDGS